MWQARRVSRVLYRSSTKSKNESQKGSSWLIQSVEYDNAGKKLHSQSFIPGIGYRREGSNKNTQGVLSNEFIKLDIRPLVSRKRVMKVLNDPSWNGMRKVRGIAYSWPYSSFSCEINTIANLFMSSSCCYQLSWKWSRYRGVSYGRISYLIPAILTSRGLRFGLSMHSLADISIDLIPNFDIKD